MVLRASNSGGMTTGKSELVQGQMQVAKFGTGGELRTDPSTVQRLSRAHQVQVQVDVCHAHDVTPTPPNEWSVAEHDAGRGGSSGTEV